MARTYFPNQRIVMIHRWKPENGNRFSASGDLAITNAIRRMNGKNAGGFLLWSVLRMNQDGYVMGMSDKYLLNEYGITKKNYLFAWNTLIEAGFILQHVGIKNRFDFYEYPEDHAKSPLKGLLGDGKSTVIGLLKDTSADLQRCLDGSFKSTLKGPETYKGHIIDSINDNIPPTPQGDVEAVAQRFESFWQEYPKRLKRKEAYQEFCKLNPNADLFQKIMDAVKDAKKSRTWQDQRYIPYAAKWLRDGRWEDDYESDRCWSYYDEPSSEAEAETHAESGSEKAKEHKPVEKPTKKPEKEKPKILTDDEMFDWLWKQCPEGNREEALKMFMSYENRNEKYRNYIIAISMAKMMNRQYSTCIDMLTKVISDYEADKKKREEKEAVSRAGLVNRINMELYR